MRLAVALTLLAALPAMADDPTPDARVFELRTYDTNEGKLDDLNTRFREHTDAIFKKHGMASVGYWTPIDAKDGRGNILIYMLAFPSREAAKQSWSDFGADPEWQKVQAESEKDGRLVNKVTSVYLEPTDFSPKVTPEASRPGRVFELRTYVASEGKLDDLLARFRDHTDAIFKKHGMTSVGYWTPLDEDKGRGNTLVYMLAFPSREAATKSWSDFRADPQWMKVKAESEKDGVPLAAKVTSVFLEPTDYSPTK